jgi:PHD/YefM family antitoxin component YafN of YafNO toxin-antitoxin module
MIIEVRRLYSFKEQACPRDMYLFRRNLEAFISELTTDKLAVYVTSHKKAIKISVKQWKKQLELDINSVINWLRLHGENETIMDNIHTRQRQQMLNGQQDEQRQQ